MFIFYCAKSLLLKTMVSVARRRGRKIAKVTYKRDEGWDDMRHISGHSLKEVMRNTTCDNANDNYTFTLIRWEIT